MRIIDRLKQFDKVEIVGYFVILFCAFLIYPSFFSMGVFPLGAENYFWSSLDPSWSLALSYANENNFIWGKDIAFTYGPLGYLSTRIGWGINRDILLLFDVFYFLNFIYIFYYTFKNAVNKFVALLIIVAVTLTIPYFLGGGIALILFMFLIFWLKLSIDKPKIIYFSIQTIFIVLLFFIKFNTGLISFGLFLKSAFSTSAFEDCKKANGIRKAKVNEPANIQIGFLAGFNSFSRCNLFFMFSENCFFSKIVSQLLQLTVVFFL